MVKKWGKPLLQQTPRSDHAATNRTSARRANNGPCLVVVLWHVKVRTPGGESGCSTRSSDTHPWACEMSLTSSAAIGRAVIGWRRSRNARSRGMTLTGGA